LVLMPEKERAMNVRHPERELVQGSHKHIGAVARLGARGKEGENVSVKN